MGTRNLTAIMSDGQYKIAQYCQWDGYPSGQGLTALKFCRENLFNQSWRDLFKKKLSLIRFISGEELAGLYASEKVDTFKSKWPQLDRDMGAKVLNYINSSEDNVMLQNEINFAADSLFCEWAYVTDLDKNTFEVYRGFNELPLSENERFFNLSGFRDENYKYYPVKCINVYSLDNLPDVDNFLMDNNPKYEE